MCWLKPPGFSPQQVNCRTISLLLGICQFGAGNNLQCSFYITACGHPYKVTSAREILDAELFPNESFMRMFVYWM